MVYSALFTVLYFVYQVFGDGCKEMDFKITKDGYALANHTFLTDKALDDAHCESKCFMDERCISFNFGRGAIGELYTCELNEADHKQFPDDLVPRPDTIYRMAENTCNCTANQVCRMDFVNKIHFCECRDPSKYIMPSCDIGYIMSNCKSFKTYDGEMILDGTDPGQSKICRSVLKTTVDLPVKPYRLIVEIYSYNVGTTQAMHPGIIFNVQDENNFDFVYFRPQAAPNCTSEYTATAAGQVVAQQLRLFPRTCSYHPPPANQWFKVEIQVYPSSMMIFLDDQYAVTYTETSNTLIKSGGLMVYNGYYTVVKFRNYIIENL